MKKTTLYIIASFIFQINVVAQLIVNRTGDNYQIQLLQKDASGNTTTANLGATTKIFSPNNPGNLVWYEYGDGKFTFQPSFQHAYHPNATVTNPFLKVTSLYEKGRKPAKILSIGDLPRNENTRDNDKYQANDKLTSSYNVQVTPNINSIQNKDTMHFAIDYRIPDTRDGWQLVFEYNTGKNLCFKQTSTKKKIYDSYEKNKFVPFIRTHNKEKVNTIYNKVIFSKLINTGRPQTVFISLETLDEVIKEGVDGGVTAYLINEKDRSISNGNQSTHSMRGTGTDPHDPNWVKVDKKCIRPNTMGIQLNYHVHFQNTGIGNADEIVHVAIKLPQNITASMLTPGSNGFVANVSGIPINTFSPFDIVSSTRFAPGIAYYDTHTHNDSIHVVFKQPNAANKIILHGMDSSKPNYMADERTMGDFKFSITLPSYKAPTDLYVQAAIIFDTEHDVLTEKEITKVRKRCKTKPNPAECNCGIKQKKTVVEWLKEHCD